MITLLLGTRLLPSRLLLVETSCEWCLLLNPLIILDSLSVMTDCRWLGCVRTLSKLVTRCLRLVNWLMTCRCLSVVRCCSRTLRTVWVRRLLTFSSLRRLWPVVLALGSCWTSVTILLRALRVPISLCRTRVLLLVPCSWQDAWCRTIRTRRWT